MVNNFENFTFILPNKIKNPILVMEKLINLPVNGSIEILIKNKMEELAKSALKEVSDDAK